MATDWRNIPSLTALRAFEATADLRSFSQAARVLNVTHAAVAQQVRALEGFTKANPRSSDGHFLLGYHYLTMSHAEAATKAR